MRQLRMVLTIAVCLGLASAAGRAAVCVTFANSTDLFEGEILASKNGFFTLSLFEATFNRAAAGAARLEGDTIYMGWTKNTDTATVAYQCNVDTVTLTGPCNINIFTTVPDGSSRLTDVATLETGNCTPGPQRRGPAPGEGSG